MYNVKCTLYNVQCMYIVYLHCTFYNVHISYTARYTYAYIYMHIYIYIYIYINSLFNEFNKILILCEYFIIYVKYIFGVLYL